MRGRCSVITNSPPTILARLVQQDRDLQGEDVLAVEIAVEAVVVPRAVFEQQRRRARLAGAVAALQERRMRVREADVLAQARLPAVGDRREATVGRGPQRHDERRQRVAEIPVFAAPKAMAGHHDAAAESILPAVEAGNGVGFRMAEQPREDRPALRVQFGHDARPVGGVQPLLDLALAHATASRLISRRLRWAPQR